MRAQLPDRRRLVRIGGAVALMLAVVVFLEAVRTPRGDRTAATPVAGTGAPIAAEADVFRLDPSRLAVEPLSAPRTGARPRTLAAFRGLRAYPGAPPRIPHSLAPAEFRGTLCLTCHERGGFSHRFGAYVPVTPHPEYRNCLQCHVPEDGAVGIVRRGDAAGGDDPDVRAPRAVASAFVPHDWRTTDWPALGRRAMDGGPPAIPHPLDLRGNCLACHAGPGAVAEIRTTHPERANCRQCHATIETTDDVFVRPVRSGGGDR